MTKRGTGDAQFAALPWRIGTGGGREVMLTTSRETRRWVIPKGWPIKGLAPADVARQEAFEEAGLVGRVVGKRPLGHFHYQKRLGDTARLCDVAVFSFRVENQLDDWPEKSERETKWFAAAEAATLVDEPELADIIERFSTAHGKSVVRRS